MIVVKRNGEQEPFISGKITRAILMAFQDVDGEVTDEAVDIASKIEAFVEKKNRKKITVEQIQDIVEEKLMNSSRKDVAQAYIRYRYLHNLARDDYNTLMNAVGMQI